MPYLRDDKQHRADQFRQQVAEQLETHVEGGEGEVNNNEHEQPCCVPLGCGEGESVHIDDPDDCQKVVCNNPECTYGDFMHKTCFETWEDEVLTYLRSSGRARSWSEKQRRQNLWTKKGYDLAWKACSCKCSKGHLRKDLEWLPPKLPEGAAAENAQQRRHRRRKKSSEKPTIGRANSISSGNGNGNGNGGHGNGHGNGNGHGAAAGGNGHGRIRHASASSTTSTESNHTPPSSPSVYQPSKSPKVNAPPLTVCVSAASTSPPATSSSTSPTPSSPCSSSSSSTTTTTSVISSSVTSMTSSSPSKAQASMMQAQAQSQGQGHDQWKRQRSSSGGNKNQNPSHHYGTPPSMQQQYPGAHHDYHAHGQQMGGPHHQGQGGRQPPPPPGNRSSQFHHGPPGPGPGPGPDFRAQSERAANMQACNANFFSNAYWNPAETMPQGSTASGGTGNRGFLPRMDLSAFYQVLPAHKLNSYHIKMEEDSQPEAEEIRSFIFATLNVHATRIIPCSLCSRKLPVFDRYPLIDGTFYLTPQRQGDGSAKSLQVQMGIQGTQYLNAVCMQCLEGVQRIVCRICKSRWDGSHHQLGTLYSYDIFAASPCCPGRAGCKRCGKPVIDPTRGTHFFSEYSRSIQCPHCGVPDFHFVKPMSSYEVHANSVQQINVC